MKTAKSQAPCSVHHRRGIRAAGRVSLGPLPQRGAMTRAASARSLLVRVGVIASLGTLALLGLAGSASARTVGSKVEAGYRADDAQFRSVSASWTIPHAACQANRSVAVDESIVLGHGGVRTTHTQTGYTGQASIETGWSCNRYTGPHGAYGAGWGVDSSGGELVVKGPHGYVPFPLRPGDRITASISATSHSVTASLVNHTAGKTAKISYPHGIDQSWATVVGAGAEPATKFSAATYLADYGRISFYNIAIVDTHGHRGTFVSRDWRTTAIREFDGGVLAAVPSSLAKDGSAFTDIWKHL
jgi:hypothetical protein